MLRWIGCLAILIGGIGFGLSGVADPPTFSKLASFLLVIIGIAVNAYDQVENC
jgi:hypothetical protein